MVIDSPNLLKTIIALSHFRFYAIRLRKLGRTFSYRYHSSTALSICTSLENADNQYTMLRCAVFEDFVKVYIYFFH